MWARSYNLPWLGWNPILVWEDVTRALCVSISAWGDVTLYQSLCFVLSFFLLIAALLACDSCSLATHCLEIWMPDKGSSAKTDCFGVALLKLSTINLSFCVWSNWSIDYRKKKSVEREEKAKKEKKQGTDHFVFVMKFWPGMEISGSPAAHTGQLRSSLLWLGASFSLYSWIHQMMQTCSYLVLVQTIHLKQVQWNPIWR